MRIAPISLREANAFVALHHRHHKPCRGHKFSIAVRDEDALLGVAIIGRPVSRGCDYTEIAEVSRLCTLGAPNACSMLYSAAARITKEMGYRKIQTYILDTEIGTSLKASGWVFEGMTAGGEWKHTTGPRRTDQPNGPKQRWVRQL